MKQVTIQEIEQDGKNLYFVTADFAAGKPTLLCDTLGEAYKEAEQFFRWYDRRYRINVQLMPVVLTGAEA